MGILNHPHPSPLHLPSSSQRPYKMAAPQKGEVDQTKKSFMGMPGFVVDFLMGGVSAAVSKTAAAPIERVKLLIQNQDEMIRAGRLDRKYDGIGECFKRTVSDEGMVSLWRATPPTSCVTSPPRPSTSPSVTPTRPCSVTRRSVTATGGGCSATLPLAVLLVPPPSSSSTPSTTPVPVLPTTPRTPSLAVTVSSTASSTSTGRPSPLTVLPVSTVVSCLPSPASSSTVVSTSVSTTPSSRSSSLARSRVTSLLLSSSAGLSPPLPVLPPTRSTPSVVV